MVDEKLCRFPGCPLPAAVSESGSGRPPEYCDDPAHNRAAAWRERKRLQRLAESRPPEETARPVQAAQQRAAEITTQLTQLADRFLDQLPKALEELRTLGDLTAAEAQIATVQSEAQEQIAAATARARPRRAGHALANRSDRGPCRAARRLRSRNNQTDPQRVLSALPQQRIPTDSIEFGESTIN
ncbi:hypothetical protein NBCG_03050 [Nocardioidaceae bacterium Broad-1]|nr:hypothetical protein NBCG_03050 [Nocardioidaceae bacterium Broad-1]